MAEVEFRDGFREVPDYLADLMVGMETYRMTVDEAIVAVNKKLERNVLEKAHNDIVKSHFAADRPGGGLR
jgi:hypothetical protein